MYWTCLDSPIGKLTLTSDGRSLTGLWTEHHKRIPYLSADLYCPDLVLFRQTKHWLQHYFQADPPLIFPPLDPQGTPFQQLVWQQLLQIPFGSLTTYGALSQLLQAKGIRSSPQAIGGAIARNPILLLIPCHRVISSTRSLTGYAGGLDTKRFLLHLEGSVP